MRAALAFAQHLQLPLPTVLRMVITKVQVEASRSAVLLARFSTTSHQGTPRGMYVQRECPLQLCRRRRDGRGLLAAGRLPAERGMRGRSPASAVLGAKFPLGP